MKTRQELNKDTQYFSFSFSFPFSVPCSVELELEEGPYLSLSSHEVFGGEAVQCAAAGSSGLVLYVTFFWLPSFGSNAVKVD